MTQDIRDTNQVAALAEGAAGPCGIQVLAQMGSPGTGVLGRWRLRWRQGHGQAIQWQVGGDGGVSVVGGFGNGCRVGMLSMSRTSESRWRGV